MDDRKIGQILVDDFGVNSRDVDEAISLHRETGMLTGQALLRLGAVSEEKLLQALSGQLGLSIVSGGDLPADESNAMSTAVEAGISLRWLLSKEAIVWRSTLHLDGDTRANPDSDANASVFVLARNPLDPGLMERVEAAFPDGVSYVLATNRVLDGALARLRAVSETRNDEELSDAERLREMAEEAPIIDFVNAVFEDALRDGASDVHIEPFEQDFKVRFRIDGVLQLAQVQPKSRFDAVASRIKLISGMDIAERRLPQDGRQSIRFAGHEVDLRVSSLPGAWGESIVMRLLKKKQELPSLEGLGLEGPPRKAFDRMVREPNGVVLVTGPTGSGKSTTLYRALELVNDGERKIITIEDPIEYDMEGVTQVQARSDIGYSFARGLRAILRQDPDVIMIGEIRDGETARIAVQAALTGHLVFSTLHTNSALAAMERLTDLGVEPFLVSAALRGLVAQRLVRRLCGECAAPADERERQLARELLERAINDGAPLERLRGSENGLLVPVGCSACREQGYSGRVAVYEAAYLENTLKAAVSRGEPVDKVLAAARETGFVTLFEDGLTKAYAGQTSISEVSRVLGAAVDDAIEA